MPIHTQSEPRLATRFSHSLDEPSRNVSDLISVVRVAADAVDVATNILQRMRDLALQASNVNNAHSNRTAIQEEFTALCSELNRIAETTSFGGKTLLNGSFGSQLFQIGESSDETVVITLGNIRADSVEMGGKKYVAENAVSPDWVVTTSTNLSLHYNNKHGEATSITLQTKQGDHLENVATYITAQTDDVQAFVGEDGKLQIFASTHRVKGEITIGGNLGTEIGFGAARDVTIEDSDLTSTGGAQQAMAVIDDGALEAVDCQRAALGALRQRQPLVHVINSLGSIDKQVATAEDRIVDIAAARESTDLTKSQMLARAAAMVLAQARQSPSSVLSLVH